PFEMASVSAVQQHLGFSSSEEEESSDASFDEWSYRRVLVRSPCRTPRVHRYRTRSITACPSAPTSPIPYSALKKLRLCDSPSTPKSLLSKSTLPCSNTKPRRSQRLLHLSTAFDQVPSVNINPFTPDTHRNSESYKRKSQRSDEDYEDDGQRFKEMCTSSEDENFFLPSKRPAVSVRMLSRYESEFLELACIGVGEFGSVYRCVKRLDGCMYAIKRSRRPIAGSANDFRAVGGCLHDAITEKGQQGELFSVPELKDLLLQVSMGLKYIHSSGLVHLDIKPSNIFICRISTLSPGIEGDSEDENEAPSSGVVYKIGDLGHVTSISSPQVEEGDSRFLSYEVLHEDYRYLPKADIFALGLTILLAAGASPLAQNGDEWHSLRQGELPSLPLELPVPFKDLLKTLLDPDPTRRPSATALCRDDVLREKNAGKLATQLRRELNVEKFRTAMLERQRTEGSSASCYIPTPCLSIRKEACGQKCRPFCELWFSLSLALSF
ncbi:hypothetical protein DNTS_003356, partial [Danionella cerebrum]